MVQAHLPESILGGHCSALVASDDAQNIIGVAAFVFDDENVCHCAILAVVIGRQRRGYGQALLHSVIGRARAAASPAVVLIVHWDNDPMIELSVKHFNASVRRIAGDPDHVDCIIPLR